MCDSLFWRFVSLSGRSSSAILYIYLYISCRTYTNLSPSACILFIARSAPLRRDAIYTRQPIWAAAAASGARPRQTTTFLFNISKIGARLNGSSTNSRWRLDWLPRGIEKGRCRVSCSWPLRFGLFGWHSSSSSQHFLPFCSDPQAHIQRGDVLFLLNDWDYHSFGRRPIDRVGDRSVIKIDSSSALPWCVLNRGQENVSVTTATLFYLYCIFPPSSSTSSSSQRGAKCCPMRGEPHSVGNDRRRVGKIHQDQLGAVAHSGLCVYVYVWRSLREHWGQTTRTPFFFHNCGEDHTILEGKS